jgi:hypothetical protein
MCRLIAKTLLCVFFASTAALCKDVTIHGFVTAINSPTSFEIDDYKVMRDKTVSLDLEHWHGTRDQGRVRRSLR